jgi:hypothetical protein
VQDLLGQINRRLRTGLKITDQQREDGLVVRFPYHPRMYPRYLGRSDSREAFDAMVIPKPSKEGSEPAGDRLQLFLELMEDSFEIAKAKKKGSNEKRRAVQIAQHRDMSKQLKRAQRYLGLRAKSNNGEFCMLFLSLTVNSPTPQRSKS